MPRRSRAAQGAAVWVFFIALVTSGQAWSQAAPADVKEAASEAAGAAAEVNAAADKAAAAKGGEREGNKLDMGVSLDPVSWWSGMKRLIELGGKLVIVQLSVSVLGLAIFLTLRTM